EALATVYRAGHEVDFSAFEQPWQQRRRVPLPTYPFQRKPFVLPAARARRPVDGHPLAGRRVRSPLAEVQFEATYDLTTLSWNEDHRIHGLAVLPTAAALEAIRAGAAV